MTQGEQYSAKLITYKSFEAFLSYENKLPAPRTFHDLKSINSRQFLYISATFGEQSAVVVVTTALMKTCKFLNYEITGEMIQRAAEEIVRKHPTCRVADLKMFESFVVSGGGEKRWKLDTRELCVLFDEYIEAKEEALEAIRAEEKRKIEKDAKIDEEKEYQHFRVKYQDRLKADWLASDQSMSIDDFCRMKFRPVENPNPINLDILGKGKIKGMSTREMAAKAGMDYDSLLSKQQEYWKEDHSKIAHEVTYEQFEVIRKKQFDIDLRKKIEKIEP